MGSPENEQGRRNSEGPQHRVTLTKGFWLGKHEVTQDQWAAVMGNNPSLFKGDKNRPVEQVSWYDCQEFIGKSNVWGESTFRLPTEAEWEYASRAGSATQFCFGDSEGGLGEYAWYDANSGDETHPVGQKKPNAFGLYDMHENVYEWCEDRYDEYSIGAVMDPMGPASGQLRVLRGGSWYFPPRNCRCARRLNGIPDDCIPGVGLRVARTP